MVEALEGTLHAAHAWLPMSALVPSSGSAPFPVWLPAEAESAHANRVRKSFQQLTRRAGITTSNGHLIAGPIQTALQTAVRQSRASIMGMGAISRRGLKRLFIGNTAERMLDRVDCDVLIVKPAGFSSSIRPRITPREPVIGPLAY